MTNKISNWTIVGYVVGFLFSLFSAIRYFVTYTDYSVGFVNIILGVIIMGLSWLYNEKLKMQHQIEGMEDYLSDSWQGYKC